MEVSWFDVYIAPIIATLFFIWSGFMVIWSIWRERKK